MFVVFHKGMFTCQMDKFSSSKNVLRILPGNEYYLYDNTHLFVPRLWHTDLMNLRQDYPDYDYIVFDEKVFLQSNIELFNMDYFSNFPTGATCTKVIKQCLPKDAFKYSILGVQDDGTRSLVNPIYFALRENNMLRLRKVYSSHKNSPVYIDNYTSTSNTTKFTRANHKFSYFNYFGTWDYIITTTCKGRIKEQIEKLEKEAIKGYLIYGALSVLEGFKFSKKIIIGRSCFLYIEKNNRKAPEIIELKSNKTSTKQLVAFLKKDSR